MNETIAEELEVLHSIYPEEIIEKGEWYEIDIICNPELPPLNFNFQFSNHYPETIPNMYLNANWLDGHEISEITSHLQSMFDKQQIIFQWIQYLKEELKDLADSKVKREDILEKDEYVMEYVPNIKILSTQSLTMKKSKFVGHVATVHSMEDVNDVLKCLYSDKKIAQATHNIFAYRFKENGIINEKADDDGEQGASQLILFLMQKHLIENYMVVVTRWFGGINLGPDRFKLIQSISKEAIELRHKL